MFERNKKIIILLLIGVLWKQCLMQKSIAENTEDTRLKRPYSVAYDPADFHCGVDDTPPVDTQKMWKEEQNCFDHMGNKYWVGYELTSCCGCINYICEINKTANCDVYFWTKKVNPQCCVDCDATVFPQGSIMRTIQHNDICKTLETEKCEASQPPSSHAYVSREMIPTQCCINETGLQPVKSKNLDPATCTVSYCEPTRTKKQPTWYTKQLYETCDCCMYNGTMVPPGFSTPISFFKNATCCEGKIVETIPPKIDNCLIQNMTYLIDTSGSMGGSKIYWEPAALQMVDYMVASQINPASYTLMDYVTTVQVTSTTTSSGAFQSSISGINVFSGGTELTFMGLLEALKLSPCHNFIMVFTDEIGNDTNDLALKAQILALRDQKKSIIFFMVVAYSNLALYQTTFGDIGHVLKIDVPDLNPVLQEVTRIMIESDICKENCTGVPTTTTSPSLPRPTAIPSTPWTSILRRRDYGNPRDYFSKRTYDEFVSGFGDPMKEFWIGLSALSNLTSSGNWMLHVELDDDNESTIQYIAQYSSFEVKPWKDSYLLIISGFYQNSTAEDCLSSSIDTLFVAPNSNNCSTKFNAGWWFNSKDCGCASLMGTLGATDGTGVVWGKNLTSFPFAEMKISPFTLPMVSTQATVVRKDD